MKYSDHTFNDPNAIKAFSHKQRLKIALRLLDLADGEKLLDFGAGDGTFAELIAKQAPKVETFIYEPIVRFYNQIKFGRKTSDMKDFFPGQFEKISCLEVLEHLNEKDLNRVLASLKELMAPNGKLIVSVPTEIGLSGLIKNIYRYFHSKSGGKLGFMPMLKSFFGLTIEKEPPFRLNGLDYIRSHTGFNHCVLRKELEKYFIVEKQCYSPSPFLGVIFSHCVFFVLSKK